MASAATFSVFPPPRVPRISIPNPHNRKPSLKSVTSPDSIKESVVIALEEVPVPKIPDEHLQVSRVQSPALESQSTTSPPIFRNGVPPPPPPLPSSFRGQQIRASGIPSTSHHGSPEPGSISSAETLVRSSSEQKLVASPVVPMRSMFPVYNPSVPLTQQNYYPQRPVASYQPSRSTDILQHDTRSLLSPSIRGSMASPMMGGSVMDIPLKDLSFNQVRYSSARELDRLWEATHGTEPNAAITSFDLEFGRLEEATFTFGSSPEVPFYTATTYDTSEISITKTCPRKRNVTCDVVLSSIEPMSRRMPPNDGLVTFIFPKMAAMLAINQSSSLAEKHELAPTHRDEIQSAAMKRAADQEASNLRYNHATKRYELEHPAISRRQRDPNFIASPQSPQNDEKSVLYITVASSERQSQEKPVILVTAQSSRPSPAGSARQGLLAAASPDTSADVHLASLDFNTNTLHIEANNILELMPSLFAIDSIVSAIVSVAIADRDSNAAMGMMDMWVPKSTRPDRSSWAGSHRSHGTAMGSVFYATIAEREEAEEQAKLAAKIHKKDMKNKPKSRSFTTFSEEETVVDGGRTWYGKSKTKKAKQKKQIVIGEFDLEKLGHYQSGTRQGQELPAVTRGLLGLMVTSLKFIVWILTMIVQFLAWIMVAVSRGVTSEKF